MNRVVIIGGGFGGLTCATELRKYAGEITLVDRRNFHLFQPLLYQVATGALSPANIAAPLRSIMKYQKNAKTILAEVTGFDLAANTVLLKDGQRLPFDTLVLATGSTHHYFGQDAAWEPHAPGLKTLEDATEIRRRVLSAFEHAETDPDITRRRKHLTFVIVGGGPTGVEMAGAIAELARQTLRRDFRTIDPADAKVILVENSDRVLEHFAEKLSKRAGESLALIGVELWLKCKVTGIAADHVLINRAGVVETLPTECVIWAAGVKANPLGRMLAEAVGGVTVDRGGRVGVNPDCTVGNRSDIFAIGDLMTLPGPDGKLLPGVAPVAVQQGQYVAKIVIRRAKGEAAPGAFKYFDKGSMATIGRSRAVLESNGIRMSGFFAWLAWLFIHILYLARFENRFMVLFQWAWNYITRNRAARLITGERAYRESP